MSYIAFILITFSAFTHAGWNLYSKKQNPTISFFLVANTCGFLLLSPVLIRHISVLSLFPLNAWLLLLLTGLFMAIYYTGLAGAYRSGDMSIAYPLARSIPILIVAGVTYLIGQGEPVTLQFLIGVGFVLFGCAILPMKSFKDMNIHNYLNLTCIFALVAALGTAGYSIIDDRNLRILRELPDSTLGTAQISIVYSFLQGVSSSSWMFIFMLFSIKEKESLKQILKNNKLNAALTGAFIFLTYTIVLIAMGYVTNVSYVVAFRQLSIPIGAIFGISLLKEPKYAPKLIGVIILFIGLIFIGTG